VIHDTRAEWPPRLLFTARKHQETTVTQRPLQRVISALATSDGAGVKLRRSLGSAQFQRLDPFLMLDEFRSDDPGDYIGGFPAHPHRGFETVTYMLDGHMRHEDSLGNRGDLGPGDVQWMTAAGGIIHSEMPQQVEGRMRGFQLWVNLPARDKMKPAAWRDIPAREIPVATLAGGVRVKVICGTVQLDGQDWHGPAPEVSAATLYLDLELPAGAQFSLPLAPQDNAFLYLYEGEALVGPQSQRLPANAAGVLGAGDTVHIQAGDTGARVLLLSGRPIGEPVVQYGPFVMNTREEIDQAISDYQSGRLGTSQSARP
jgi:quercetin 2,3-dioxygenase